MEKFLFINIIISALNIFIIPIGLSYSDQIRFRSNIMIRFGNPIKLKDFEKDYKLNEIDTVKKVTSIIRKSLNQLTNYYQTDQIDAHISIKDLNKLYEAIRSNKEFCKELIETIRQ